jgi:hypothetical protein
MSMFTSGFGVPFGTPVVPSSTTGSSPPRDDGGSVGKSGRGLFDGSRGTGMCVLCVGDIGRTVCGGAGTNFKVIASRLYDIQASLTIHDLPAMDHHLSNLQQLIGDRPDGQAPHEILAYLVILESSIQKLRDNPQTTLTKLEQHQLHLLLQQFEPTLQGLRDVIEPAVTTCLEPMNRFFQQHTSSVAPGQPLVLGDVLHTRLAAMESSVSSLQNSGWRWQQQASRPPHFGSGSMSTPVRAGHGNSASQFGMGGFGRTSSFNTPPGNHGALTVDLENLIYGLTARINELENTVTADDGPPITLEGIQIKNKIQLKAWLTTNTDQSVKDLVSCFPDVLGLLGMAGRFVKELEFKAVKAGYGSVNQFLISKSFTLPLPAIFGTEKEGGAGDARILPKFKTFESFDPQLSFTGGLIEIKAKVKLEVESTLAHINHNLTGAARSVAKACVMDADKFIGEILGWMSATYHMLSKSGGNTSPSENWNYVSYAVCGIFAHLQRARSTGYGTKEVANMI